MCFSTVLFTVFDAKSQVKVHRDVVNVELICLVWSVTCVTVPTALIQARFIRVIEPKTIFSSNLIEVSALRLWPLNCSSALCPESVTVASVRPLCLRCTCCHSSTTTPVFLWAPKEFQARLCIGVSVCAHVRTCVCSSALLAPHLNAIYLWLQPRWFLLPPPRLFRQSLCPSYFPSLKWRGFCLCSLSSPSSP